MDPISAAGIGLSITSLALQVFAGCIKGYQLFADAEGMPAEYQHLRVRLRIEQTRLLNWGHKVGLVEELLDEPSRTLQQNRNLILDILLEIQILFKDCVTIEAKYNRLVPMKSSEFQGAEEKFDKRFPKGTNSMLKKTLSFLEKARQSPERLQWAILKHERFESLIQKLIGYNNSIEGLLDSSAIENLQFMQQQTYMAMLQLNSNVVELKEISQAMQIRTQAEAPQSDIRIDSADRQASFALLADFKAQQMMLEREPPSTGLSPIDRSDISLDIANETTRPEAVYQGKKLWIEWKNYLLSNNQKSPWNLTIEDRIQKLATLLGSQNKPSQFHAPHCLGYFNDQAEERYGFLYLKPKDVPSSTKPISLLNLIATQERPTLSKRITLAHAIAHCLMYLHSVNWLHKGLRSNNIIFFTPPGKMPEYGAPIIAGFEYARPDFPEEETEPPPQHSEHDIYRHPAVLSRTSSRSQKSHDIYSLGVVLVEIACWQSIDTVMDMPKDPKAARSKIRKVRGKLLEEENLNAIAANVGEVYREVVRRCLSGGAELGIQESANETDAEVGASMQEVFSERIVNKLGAIKI